MTHYSRHDLIWLSGAGRDYALRNIQNCIPLVNDKEIRALMLCDPPIPAIVRRQEPSEDALLCIGFSSFLIIDGVRLRIACKAPLDCIARHKTPFDIAKCEKSHASELIMPGIKILEELADVGKRCHVQVGCFCSAALQMATELPYLHKNSDLDLYLRCEGSQQDLEHFFEQLLNREKQSGISIDAELEFPGKYGVKLKELFGPGKTVLGKGLYDVALLDKHSLWGGKQGRFPEP